MTNMGTETIQKAPLPTYASRLQKASPLPQFGLVSLCPPSLCLQEGPRIRPVQLRDNLAVPSHSGQACLVPLLEMWTLRLREGK